MIYCHLPIAYYSCSTHQMDYATACEVHEGGAEGGHGVTISIRVGQKSTATPAPMRNDGIDERRHDNAVDGEALHHCALCHGAAHDGAAGGTKRTLKEPLAKLCFVLAEVIHEEL